MKRLVGFVGFILLGSMIIFLSPKHQEHTKTLGVIVPMEHEALAHIVSGLKQTLDKDVKIKVFNAQGDVNIQHSLIEQLVRDQCDILLPIGTTTSLMTMNLAKNQDIVCLAADVDLLKGTNQSATVIDDNLSVDVIFSFIQTVLPKIKKITLLYSSSEKVAKEVPKVFEAAQLRDIKVQGLMVYNLPELYTISQAIASDSDAIFILKDHLIVSGIQTIVQQAEKLHIPVITSDEGSVTEGAAFALGVRETSIGELGAKMAQKILEGASARNVPPIIIDGPFTAFVNQKACIKQGINVEDLTQRIKNEEVSIHFIPK